MGAGCLQVPGAQVYVHQHLAGGEVVGVDGEHLFQPGQGAGGLAGLQRGAGRPAEGQPVGRNQRLRTRPAPSRCSSSSASTQRCSDSARSASCSSASGWPGTTRRAACRSSCPSDTRPRRMRTRARETSWARARRRDRCPLPSPAPAPLRPPPGRRAPRPRPRRSDARESAGAPSSAGARSSSPRIRSTACARSGEPVVEVQQRLHQRGVARVRAGRILQDGDGQAGIHRRVLGQLSERAPQLGAPLLRPVWRYSSARVANASGRPAGLSLQAARTAPASTSAACGRAPRTLRRTDSIRSLPPPVSSRVRRSSSPSASASSCSGVPCRARFDGEVHSRRSSGSISSARPACAPENLRQPHQRRHVVGRDFQQACVDRRRLVGAPVAFEHPAQRAGGSPGQGRRGSAGPPALQHSDQLLGLPERLQHLDQDL